MLLVQKWFTVMWLYFHSNLTFPSSLKIFSFLTYDLDPDPDLHGSAFLYFCLQ
jgi:hypothetical protein